jgi:fibronectin-binding autotransporter adhesin
MADALQIISTRARSGAVTRRGGRFAIHLSSVSVLALAAMSTIAGRESAVAAATCTTGSSSGTTSTINLNGTTCTLPFVPGITTTNVTNNPQTPTPATQGGTLFQDASALANLNGASSFTVGGTISDGTGPTSVYLNLPNFTLISNITSTYTGTTTLAGGTLMLGGAGVLSAASTHSVLAGAILDLGGTSQTLNMPLMLQGGTVQNGSITGAISSSGGTIANTTLSGNLVTTGGTTTVSGTDNVGSLINGGTLNLAGTLNIASGLTNNGTFSANGGTYNIGQASTVTNNGTFNATIGSTSLTVVNNAGATWNGAVVFNSA